MKIKALTRYSDLGASSRIRFIQYFSFLKKYGLEIDIFPLINNNNLILKYKYGYYSIFKSFLGYFYRIKSLLAFNKKDILWIEKELFPWCPLFLEFFFLRGKKYVLDYDDAIFHNYDLHKNSLIRKLYSKKIDGLMSKAYLVIAGNKYLAERALSAGCRHVEIIPSVIDLMSYRPESLPDKSALIDGIPRIVWIGSPATVKYLDLIRNPLKKIAKDHEFIFRIIGAKNFSINGVVIEEFSWSQSTEFESIASCDIGIMPLIDSMWEKGKCGYKLIQYMACSLPVIASSVGVNNKIIHHGQNGYLAMDETDWIKYIKKLIIFSKNRHLMGLKGRKLIESEYCVQIKAPVLADLFKRL